VVETWLLAPLALAWLLFGPQASDARSAWWSGGTLLWLIGTGPVTLTPLLCFNAAARHLPYATLGFLQYIAPSLNFLVAVLLFREPFDTTQLVGFALIWFALALYSVDMLRAGRKATRAR